MIYFNHSKPKQKKHTFRELKFVNDHSRKYNRLMLFSLGCLFLIAILNVALFLYLTNKSKIANDIAESADKMGVEIVVLQGKIHKAESIARISNDAKISGLSRNTAVKVLSVAEDNIGLR